MLNALLVFSMHMEYVVVKDEEEEEEGEGVLSGRQWALAALLNTLLVQLLAFTVRLSASRGVRTTVEIHPSLLRTKA